MAVVGYGAFWFGPEISARWTRDAAPHAAPPPVSLAPPPGLLGIAEAEPAASPAVTVIVELPEAEPPPLPSYPGASGSPAPGEPVPAPLGPQAQGAFLSAVLAEQTPQAAAEASTRAALGLYGVERSPNPVSGLEQALGEIRDQGLDVLELPEANLKALLDLNYPALVQLSSPGGEPRLAALVGIGHGDVELMGLGNRIPLVVAEEVMEAYWDGPAWVVWNPFLDLPDVIREGARGEEVRWLQSALTRLGYLEAHIPGVYDISTLRGVERFQGRHAMEADGLAGPRTQMLLYGALDEFAPPQLVDEDSG